MRLLDLIKPQNKQRIRYQEDGSELDLDVAIRSLIDFRSGVTPDPRINMSHRTSGRSIAVLLLLDLSESLNQKVAGGEQTVLELSQEAVSLLGMAIERLNDPFAIAGFHSNTRHEVRYLHIKGFSERWDDTVKGRLAAAGAGWSTRMGAALRHAGAALAQRQADKRLLLLLTDGEPADIDARDPGHLHADARKAVERLGEERPGDGLVVGAAREERSEEGGLHGRVGADLTESHGERIGRADASRGEVPGESPREIAA